MSVGDGDVDLYSVWTKDQGLPMPCKNSIVRIRDPASRPEGSGRGRTECDMGETEYLGRLPSLKRLKRGFSCDCPCLGPYDAEPAVGGKEVG